MSPDLRRYAVLEARHTVGRLPLVGLAFGAMGLVVDQLVFPRLPKLALDLMERAFQVHGLGQVIMLNDFIGIYMALYFVGVAQLWGVAIGPRDERHLELLLAKPVPPTLFLAARVVPILAATLGVGLLLAAGCGLGGMRHGLAPGGTAGAVLVLTAVTMGLLLVVDALFLWIRDALFGFLAACMLWFATMVPAAVMLYRPDLLAGRQGLLDWVALPTLVWHADVMPVAGALAIAAVTLLAWPAILGSAWLLDRYGIQ